MKQLKESELEQKKDDIIELIDSNTEKTISNGFTFDGIVFSLSTHAQINISNIPNIPEAGYPFVYLGKNDEVYNLTFANSLPFYFTALNTVKNIKITNGAIKTQARACTTIEELQTILDSL